MSFKATRPLIEPRDVDWARLAAYIDGEGCISIKMNRGGVARRQKRPALYVSVCITNTDPRLTNWLAITFGGSSHTEDRRDLNPNWSKCSRWDIASAHARWILQGCLPFFVLKKDQAEIALAFGETLARTGRHGTPDAVVERQMAMKDQLSELKGNSSRSNRLKRTINSDKGVPLLAN